MQKSISKNTYKGTILNGKRLYIHRLVWEKEYGPIPKGFIIHHIDGNKSNNDLNNLQLVTPKEHVEIHKVGELNKKRLTGKILSQEHRKAISDSLKGKMPKNISSIKGWNKGRKETRPEVLKRQSESHIGQKSWNKVVRMEKFCMTCNKIIYVLPRLFNETKYCSKKCYGISKLKKPKGLNID